jgi:uncharacterized protein YyaL (SSP411 family)
MLYDQAQLAISYLEAFQITREPVLERAARGILDYVLRDMTAPGGGFFSAEDADSAADAAKPRETSEGAFYLWDWAELEQLLGRETAAAVAARFGMRREGNVDNDPHHEFTGRNILFQAQDVDRPLGHAMAAMLEARGKRPRPHLDDKVLTAWNGLMISAFAKAAAVLGDATYATAAGRAAEFILSTLRTPEGGLLRRFRDGEAAIEGMLDDYAFFAQGLLDLYEATFEFRWLEEAAALTDKQRELLEDPEGGFFSSAHADVRSLMEAKDDYDGAEPSGNSVALMNLLRLRRMTGRAEYEEAARRLIAAFEPKLRSAPWGMPQMLAACEFDVGRASEAVVAGPREGGMARLLRAHFDPNRVLLYAEPGLVALHPQMADMKPGNTAGDAGQAVYLCEDFTCQAPVFDEEGLFRLLK